MRATRVILVEDDEDDKELFHSFIGGRADILLLPTVGNGLELKEYLESAKEDELPDLIVLDQNMPMMNGKQTLKFLKNSDRFANITTVVYSTYADSALISDCKNLGAIMVASKPIDQDGYEKMMDEFMTVFQE
jgi:CheY-like chemotaxis protein